MRDPAGMSGMHRTNSPSGVNSIIWTLYSSHSNETADSTELIWLNPATAVNKNGEVVSDARMRKYNTWHHAPHELHGLQQRCVHREQTPRVQF